jgi:hypothetical protein
MSAPRVQLAEPTVRVGEPFHLVVEIPHAAGLVAVLPEAPSFGPEIEERRAARAFARAKDPEGEVDRYTLELVAFDAGEFAPPPLAIKLGDATLEVALPAIRVESGLEGDARAVATSTRPEAAPVLEQLAATDPSPRAIEILDGRVVGGAAALVVALVAAWLVRRWLKSRPTPAEAAPPPPAPPPLDASTIAALQRLRRAPADTAAAQKLVFVELSEIVRRYLGARFGFDALELTTGELLAALEARATPGLDARALRDVLEVSDLAKFAKLTVSVAEVDDTIGRTMAIVVATTPAPPPSAGPAEAA